MIPKIAARGVRVGGLLRYLYGPGRREEHIGPHLVAAWGGAPPLADLEPRVGDGGRLDLRHLVDLLEQPVRAGRHPPRRPVWHCSVRNHPGDRVLSDAQWGHIAREMMAGAGLAPHGDDRAVRWVAVRHAADHVHLVATLVRQDRRTEWARNDRWRCQATARDLEQRYGLYRVAPADRTAHRYPHSTEVNKALRGGRRETGRDRLRREVRYAAAGAGSEREFFALLAAAGVQVRLRRGGLDPRQVTGYAVAVADHTTAAGQPIWYGGGRLAVDLTLPRLRRRWGQTRTGAPIADPLPQAELYERVAAQVAAAAVEVRRAVGGAPGAGAAAAAGAADVLTVAARLVEGARRGPLHRAIEALDRSAREPFRVPLPATGRGEALRAMARLLRLAGELSDNEALFRLLRMIVNLSLLADALAELREAQQRLHQARAARSAARWLRAAAGSGRATPVAARGPVAVDGPGPAGGSGPAGGPGVTAPATLPPTVSPTAHRDGQSVPPGADVGRGR